jgi:MFS family permease
VKEPEDVASGRDPRDIILPRPGFRTVLANRDFRLIWSAQVASQLADKFLMFALLILTYSISRASTHGAALFLAYTFPSVFLSPLAGVYADRHDKKRLMFFTNAIRGGLILLIPLSQVTPYFEHVTWHLFVIIFLFASVGQIFAPAEAASIPFIVGSEELMTATSMFTSTVIVTLLVAVPLSTFAVRFLGTDSPYWIAAALFVAAAGLIYLVKTDLHARTHQTSAEKTDILYELREGIGYIAARPLVRFAVLQLSLTIAVIFSVFVLAPSYMSTVLRLQATDVYLFLAPAVIGMLAAAFYLGQYGRHFRRSRLLSRGAVPPGAAGRPLVAGLVPGRVRLHRGPGIRHALHPGFHRLAGEDRSGVARPHLRRHVHGGQRRRRHPDLAGRWAGRPVRGHPGHLRHGRSAVGQRRDLGPDRPSQLACAPGVVDERQIAGIIAGTRAHSSVGTSASMTRKRSQVRLLLRPPRNSTAM